MSKLTSKGRKGLKSSQFALPTERKYPINDAAHAKNAKARASQMANKGVISQSTKAAIFAKANKKLGKQKH